MGRNRASRRKSIDHICSCSEILQSYTAFVLSLKRFEQHKFHKELATSFSFAFFFPPALRFSRRSSMLVFISKDTQMAATRIQEEVVKVVVAPAVKKYSKACTSIIACPQ
jgi:hypothetical protein